MSDASPFESSEVGVTIKYGPGYDDSWASFKGSPAKIRQNIIEFFGLDEQSVDGLFTSDVVVEASKIAQGVAVVASRLGGTVVKPDAEDPWADGPEDKKPAEQPAEENPADALRVKIGACKDVTELKRLWATNKSAFDADETLFADWKKQGKALKAAA